MNDAPLKAAGARAREGAYIVAIWWTDGEGICACPKRAACPSPGKHPLTPGGLDDASRDLPTIESWFARWPAANAAARTDEVVRIDVDLTDVAAALSSDIPLQAQTELVRTPGRGGLHIALRPRGEVTGRTLFLKDGRKLGELKAARGYVLVPPSRIGQGRYELISAPGVGPLEVDDPVVWLGDILPAFGFELAEGDAAPRRQYELLKGVIYEGEGRHNALVSYAGKVWVEGMAPETLTAVLQAVNEGQCRPPLPGSEVDEIAAHFIARREPRGMHDPAIVSCGGPDSGRNVEQLLDLAAEARASTASPDDRHDLDTAAERVLTRIVVTNRHLHEISSDGWAALLAGNSPPRLFQHGGAIAEIGRDDEGRAHVSHVTMAGLRGRLDRAAIWVRLTEDGEKPARPPKDVVEDIDAMAKHLPVLRGVVGTPMFAADGSLVTTPGYQEATRLFYEASGDWIPPVPAQPDETDLRRAKQLIFQDWLADFPFVDDCSMVNLLAAVVTAIAREMIDGPVPLFAIDAPTPGTGKGLLASGVGIITTGSEPAVMSEPRGDDELRKRVTALLCEGTAVVLFDNIKRPLRSGVLAALLTATTWSDRVLGRTQTTTLPVRTVWLATGNNLQLDGEIARRTVWVRLDSRRDRPWERTGFRHAHLLPWMRRHRHDLVWAFLVLVQHWIARARPPWTGRPLGSYEAWCAVVGGVFDVAGIGGFLGNREELYRRTDAETEEWRAFARWWWERHGSDAVKAAELVTPAQDLLPTLFEKVKEGTSGRALATRLGKALAERRDQRLGDLFIRRGGEDSHNGGALWRLEPAEPDVTLADVEGAMASTSAQHPQGNEPSSGSAADDADIADIVSGVDLTSSPDTPRSEKSGAGAFSYPHLPQHPQTDLNPAGPAADVARKMPAQAADVPLIQADRSPCRGGCGRTCQAGSAMHILRRSQGQGMEEGPAMTRHHDRIVPGGKG